MRCKAACRFYVSISICWPVPARQRWPILCARSPPDAARCLLQVFASASPIRLHAPRIQQHRRLGAVMARSSSDRKRGKRGSASDKAAITASATAPAAHAGTDLRAKDAKPRGTCRKVQKYIQRLAGSGAGVASPRMVRQRNWPKSWHAANHPRRLHRCSFRVAGAIAL